MNGERCSWWSHFEKFTAGSPENGPPFGKEHHLNQTEPLFGLDVNFQGCKGKRNVK